MITAKWEHLIGLLKTDEHYRIEYWAYTLTVRRFVIAQINLKIDFFNRFYNPGKNIGWSDIQYYNIRRYLPWREWTNFDLFIQKIAACQYSISFNTKKDFF